jgi:tripartite-type tricarboxylate transporter receptor subunit TctC
MIGQHRRRFLHLFAAAAASPLLSRSAVALDYPLRPVRVIVPFAPGGITDVVTRLVAAALSEEVGKQFYVENIVGGSGNVGMGQAARAAPDGYTMLTAFSSLVINPTLFGRVPYDPVKDFDPVSLAVTSASVLVVNPALPVSSVKELVALVRAKPGTYTYASAGTGTTSHLAGEQFRLSLGLDLVHVPFTGGAPAMASVVAGPPPIGLGSMASVVPLMGDRTLRVLAVTSKVRSQALPDVVTMAEAGYPNIEGDNFVGFVVPARTPPEIVTLLNGAIVRAMAARDMKERQLTLGNEPVGSSAEAFGSRIKAELALWSKVIRAAGIRAG